MGGAQFDLDRYGDAETSFRFALNGQKTVVSMEHHAQYGPWDLRRTLAMRDNLEESEWLLRQILHIREKGYGDVA